MGVDLSSKRAGRFRKFWLNLKGWQKGGIIGLLITLVLSILLGLISGHLFFLDLFYYSFNSHNTFWNNYWIYK